MREVDTQTIERVMVGQKTIELVRPISDSICNPDEIIEPQLCRPDKLYMANEEGPCGGVEMAELVMDKLIAFRDKYREVHGVDIDIGLFANHPPSKGADRALLYQNAGVEFGKPIDEIPPGSIYLFSAHGADPQEVEKARSAGLFVVDTTCPLVGHIYVQIKKSVKPAEVTLLPHEVGIVYLSSADMGHPEVQGTKGVAKKAGVRFIPVTSKQEALDLADGEQKIGPEVMSLTGLRRVMVTGLTTNNSDTTRELAVSFEQRLRSNGAGDDFVQPYDERSVCNTVKFRQDAIRWMVGQGAVESIIVIGALGSNNTNQLVAAALDEASKTNPETLALKKLVFANTHHDIPEEIEGAVGIVSGASTQQRNINQIVQKLNVTDEKIIRIGRTDKNGFRPMGGSAALARRVLAGDFDWFNVQAGEGK